MTSSSDPKQRGRGSKSSAVIDGRSWLQYVR